MQRLARAVAALALGLFILAPSVEAAVCGSEPTHASAAALHAQTGSDEGTVASAADPTGKQTPSGDIDVEACAHGHCHHAGAAMAPALAPSPRAPVHEITAPAAPPQAPPSLHPARLKRPPRS